MESDLKDLNKRRMRGKRGFSLIEVVMVATISAFVALGIGSVFVSGMKIWQRARGISFEKNNLLLDLEGISRRLRQTVSLRPDKIYFSGKSDEMSFPSLAGDNLIKYTYKFKPEEKAVFCSEVTLKEVLEDDLQEPLETKVLASVESFVISYLCLDIKTMEYVWTSSWDSAGADAPKAVKFEIISSSGSSITKIIYLPIS
jgi:prepilin-type N-terminal cleavage/methylation domain-containing protein